MIKFISLDTIITDLLNIIRGSKISQSETISRRQVEAWVNFYRSILIKQDLDKGKMPNPDYIQEIPSLKLEVADLTAGSTFESGKYLMRTILELPETIDLNHKSGFMYVGTIDGNEMQFVPEGRTKWQKYKRFTNNVPLVFLRNKRLYVDTVTPIQYITVRGIFEVPTEVSNFMNPNSDVVYSTYRDRYPMPSNWVPIVKEMILSKELGILASTPSDNVNDGANNMTVNAESSN